MTKEMQARAFEFHQHLDACEQCEKHPFDLCERGVALMKAMQQAQFSKPTQASATADKTG